MRYTGIIYIHYRYMYEQFFICQATGIKHRTLTDINHVVLKGLSFLLTLKMFDIVNSLITSSWQLIRIGKIILSLLAKNKIPCGWLYSGYSLKIKMKQNWDTICSTPNVKSLCTRDNRCCCNTLYATKTVGGKVSGVAATTVASCPEILFFGYTMNGVSVLFSCIFEFPQNRNSETFHICIWQWESPETFNSHFLLKRTEGIFKFRYHPSYQKVTY